MQYKFLLVRNPILSKSPENSKMEMRGSQNNPLKLEETTISHWNQT